jgi:hypothetical protein
MAEAELFTTLFTLLVGSPSRRTAASRPGQFARLKTAAAVRSVTKWLILGLSAAAQGHGFFPGRNCEFVAQVVNDFDGPQDKKWSIFSTANQDGLSHGFPPRRLPGTSKGERGYPRLREASF